MIRLSSPPLENVNEDFICSICQKVLNDPRECSNSDQCGRLFCAHCCKQDGNSCPSCNKGLMKAPSKVILKIYQKYMIRCPICCLPFPIAEVLRHEQMCTRMKCSNELCGQELSGKKDARNDANPSSSLAGFGVHASHDRAADDRDKLFRFQINGIEMIACSKKCKKVAKFAYLLKKNNENQILKTFETMLRKRMQKNLEQAQLQPRSLMAKSITMPLHN